MNSRPLKLYLFCCSTTVDTEELLRCCSKIDTDDLKAVSIPCSGKVDVLYLIKAFETGADGVVIATCRKDECRYIEGNLRAAKRAEAVDELLQEIGLGRGRISVIEIKDGETEQLISEIENFRVSIRNMLVSGDGESVGNQTGNTSVNHTVSPETGSRETIS